MMRVITIAAVVALVSAAHASRLVLMSEDFEHGGTFPPPGWTVESQGPGANWELAGNSADYWARVRGTADFNAQDERLISPIVNCTGYPAGLKLKFWTYYEVYSSQATDTAFIDVSTNGGSSWQTIRKYYGATQGYNPDSVAVPQAANQSQVRFRWRYYAPSWEHRKQWQIDDVVFEAGVAHDVGVDSLMGPSANDRLRAGASVRVWARVRNYTANAESGVQVTCTSNPAGYSSSTTIPSLAGYASTLVSFPSLWTVPASGTYTLTATTSLASDGDPSNDASSAAGLTPVSFAASEPLLLSYEDATQRDAYQAALAGLGVASNTWDRATQGNLYGLDAWTTVIFAVANGAYPLPAAQMALMRFFDEGTAARGPKYLLISGDDIGHFFHIGVLSSEFFTAYLHATCDGGYVSPPGAATFSAPPCSYIGGVASTDTLAVNQYYADEIGADAQAETLYAWQWSPVAVPVAIQYASPEREHVFLGFNFSDITSATQRQDLLGRILAWFAGPPAPAPITQFDVTAVGTTVTLAWPTDPSWVCPTFRIYRSTTAFFLPGAVYQQVASSPFTDPGAAADPAVNYFYRVAPVDFGVEGSPSPTKGVFDFDTPYVP